MIVPSRRLRRTAEAQIAAAFSRGARIGRIDGSVLGELVARDVELAAADGRTYARVGELRIELAGELVTFVVNRNINVSNICTVG